MFFLILGRLDILCMLCWKVKIKHMWRMEMENYALDKFGVQIKFVLCSNDTFIFRFYISFSTERDFKKPNGMAGSFSLFLPRHPAAPIIDGWVIWEVPLQYNGFIFQSFSIRISTEVFEDELQSVPKVQTVIYETCITWLSVYICFS